MLVQLGADALCADAVVRVAPSVNARIPHMKRIFLPRPFIISPLRQISHNVIASCVTHGGEQIRICPLMIENVFGLSVLRVQRPRIRTDYGGVVRTLDWQRFSGVPNDRVKGNQPAFSSINWRQLL